MKRLKSKLLAMDSDTVTYSAMYDGSMGVIPLSGPDYADNDPTYYSDAVGFFISGTHKLAQDKPSVEIRIPAEMLGIRTYTAAAADHCLRVFAPYIDALNAGLYNRSRPDSENGRYYLARPSGEILARNTAYFALRPQKDYTNGGGSTVYLMENPPPPAMCLCLRIQVQLPRRKLRKAVQMLCRDLPEAVEMFMMQFDPTALEKTLALAEKQAAIRRWLRDSECCAFIANGSILPREKGTQRPLRDALPFQSTARDEIEIAGVRGMGIRRGVTVITGGGYSGKSTLLDAIAAGIYDHCSGDGRELCITDESAVSVSAEEGRAVRRINISPFIRWIPGGDPADFSTDHASGSTSQAANVMEAVEAGARLLLLDEDRSAANFMIRDRMMKELIAREPITPFTDRVGEAARRGVSSVLVIGGSGEYLACADRVYRMDEYRISDVTEEAHRICGKYGIRTDAAPEADWSQRKHLPGEGYSSYPEGSGSEKLTVSGMGFICIGDQQVDIRGLRALVSDGQRMALGFILRYLAVSRKDGDGGITERLDALYEQIALEGVDLVYSSFFTECERFLDLPRKEEILAVIRRMR